MLSPPPYRLADAMHEGLVMDVISESGRHAGTEGGGAIGLLGGAGESGVPAEPPTPTFIYIYCAPDVQCAARLDVNEHPGVLAGHLGEHCSGKYQQLHDSLQSSGHAVRAQL